MPKQTKQEKYAYNKTWRAANEELMRSLHRANKLRRNFGLVVNFLPAEEKL